MGVIRREVAHLDDILTVRVQGDVRYQVVHQFGIDDSELHLDKHLVDVHGRIASRHRDRCGGLTAVHDLEVADGLDDRGGVRFIDGDPGGRGGQSVVVGQEPFGFVAERLADSPVDERAGHEEGPDVSFEEASPVLLVEVGEVRSGKEEKVGLDIRKTRGAPETSDPRTEPAHQVDVDGFEFQARLTGSPDRFEFKGAK